MTASVHAAVDVAWRPRSEVELAAQQLRAIDRFNTARRLAERAAAAASRSREMRMDATRRLEVLRREHAAVVARAHEQLRLTGDLLCTTAAQRVVLAHRNAWFVGKVSRALEDEGLQVVAQVDNGADAVGVIVCEQPDLVLVEETLAMVPGEAVVREVRALSPQTLVAAQVQHADRSAALREAGASLVFTRAVGPLDVALGVASLLPHPLPGRLL
jgi:CheY-like chemotaxis protein